MIGAKEGFDFAPQGLFTSAGSGEIRRSLLGREGRCGVKDLRQAMPAVGFHLGDQ
jgi:hypothetical protein